MVAFILSRGNLRHLVVKINYFRGYSSVNGELQKYPASTGYQSIGDFYSGKSVLVTGGTGYCGKVLVEKLLYSCTDLDKIYLLIRDKKDASVDERLKEMFENPLYMRIKETNPKSLDKVVPVRGDITLPQLGVSPEDQQMLIDKVSVVFHVAATVMFNEPLPIPMSINFEGTQKVLNLCKRIKNMEGFVFVSTAFCHTHRPVLKEKVYPAPAKVEDVYKFLKVYADNEEETKKFIRPKPNTYTFTKALTEAYIGDNHEHVPTCIVRPSIVTPTVNEPIKGWIDNWFGGTCVLHNAGKGWDHISVGDRNRIADLIPVDYLANLCIIAGARIHKSKSIQVFNSTTSAENPILWDDAYKYMIKESVYQGYNEVPFPFMTHSKSKTVIELVTLLQYVPAHIADTWLRLKGDKPKYVKLLSKVVRHRNAYEHFISQSWTMEADRTMELYLALSPEDQKEFPCNPTDINWPEYMRDFCNGIQKYLKPKYTAKSYVKLLSKVVRHRNAYEHFISQSWTMEADRTMELYLALSPEDQKEFPCNPTDINWPEYMRDFCNGIQKYLKPKYTAKS